MTTKDSMLHTFQVVLKPHPFHHETVTADVPAGSSIADALGQASHSAEVTLDGHHVPREMWGKIRPKAGHHLHVANYPQGGGNGSKWIRAVAMVVIAYFSYGVGSGAIGGLSGGYAAAAGAAISVVGTMAGPALIPEVAP